ncbi:pseudouridine synthase [Thermophagus sp. OGC60D27]|uniref:pseudouridine synthase n=1 Tax=Thermophagus sp. OGC60D27 TaxID=3458415 RepID=UPI004037BBE2
MAKKGKIPGKYTSTARRSRNENFQHHPRKKKIERSTKPESTSKQPIVSHDESSRKAMRLNRFIANSGVCSRREADKLIERGDIKVNGKKVTELGTIVSVKDIVEYQGKKLNPEKKVYLLLNKPKDTVTTARDPEGRKTVLDIVRNACPQRIFPVGRLDRNTTGLLLLTNDGDLAKKLTHPSFEAKKIYHVFLDKKLDNEDFDTIANGLELEDGPVKPDSISFVDPKDLRQIGVEIHSGKNRIVRRIFEHLGYKVEKLDRVYFAGLTKKNIPRGKWRFLAEKEINLLKAGFTG